MCLLSRLEQVAAPVNGGCASSTGLHYYYYYYYYLDISRRRDVTKRKSLNILNRLLQHGIVFLYHSILDICL